MLNLSTEENKMFDYCEISILLNYATCQRWDYKNEFLQCLRSYWWEGILVAPVFPLSSKWLTRVRRVRFGVRDWLANTGNYARTYAGFHRRGSRRDATKTASKKRRVEEGARKAKEESSLITVLRRHLLPQPTTKNHGTKRKGALTSWY